jgi:hypothetical protein
MSPVMGLDWPTPSLIYSGFACKHWASNTLSSRQAWIAFELS